MKTAKSLKIIFANLSMRNPALIPEQKLCISCYSLVLSKSVLQSISTATGGSAKFILLNQH